MTTIVASPAPVASGTAFSKPPADTPPPVQDTNDTDKDSD